MYSQPKMFTNSLFYFLSIQLNPGIIGVDRNNVEFPGYTRGSVGFLPYTDLAQNQIIYIESNIRNP